MPYLLKYIFTVYNMYSSMFHFLRNIFREIYHVHIHVLVLLYQINSNNCTHILLNHHFINTTC